MCWRAGEQHEDPQCEPHTFFPMSLCETVSCLVFAHLGAASSYKLARTPRRARGWWPTVHFLRLSSYLLSTVLGSTPVSCGTQCNATLLQPPLLPRRRRNFVFATSCACKLGLRFVAWHITGDGEGAKRTGCQSKNDCGLEGRPRGGVGGLSAFTACLGEWWSNWGKRGWESTPFAQRGTSMGGPFIKLPSQQRQAQDLRQ